MTPPHIEIGHTSNFWKRGLILFVPVPSDESVTSRTCSAMGCSATVKAFTFVTASNSLSSSSNVSGFSVYIVSVSGNVDGKWPGRSTYHDVLAVAAERWRIEGRLAMKTNMQAFNASARESVGSSAQR